MILVCNFQGAFYHRSWLKYSLIRTVNGIKALYTEYFNIVLLTSKLRELVKKRTATPLSCLHQTYKKYVPDQSM